MCFIREAALNIFKMESDSALHGELPDGAEMSPLEENLPDLGETSDNNVPANDSEAVSVEETGVK